MKRLLTTLILSTIILTIVHAATIGQWKAYMAYSDITEIEKGGNTLYVLASNNLFSFNQDDQSIQTYDKVNALNDANIAHIKWCQSARRLVIVYSNQNIDLMDESGDVVNISDYMNKSLTGDKTVYSIDISGQNAYLSTGFGIVKINVRNAEISDSYMLGFRVDYSYLEGNYLYAASSTQGLYRSSSEQNMLNPNNWSRVGGYTARNQNLDADLLATVSALQPGGPKNNYFGFMRFHQGKLYTCGGVSEVTTTVQIYDGDNWNCYSDEFKSTLNNRYVGLYCLDIDPANENHLFVGSQTGLYEFLNGQFVGQYTNDNSLYQTAATVKDNTNKNYVMVTGVKFDDNGNLWTLNSIAPTQSLIELTKEKKWVSHHKSEFMNTYDRTMDNITSPMFDSRKLLWFVNDDWRTPSLLCYQPSTDAVTRFDTFINEDGTEVKIYYVRCVAEDNEGNIWIGTNAGPLMLEKDHIYDNPKDVVFTQVKVPRNDGTNYADYLLSGVDISNIVIDGAGRKWFGTNGQGIYLISEDNLEEIHHFTASNSPLPADYITSMAINQTTGELFVGTTNGLCSYMSDATATNEEMTKDNVWAYPNPVEPDYTGIITVTGLSYQSDVKITTSNGVIVAEGKSNGGTFTWDGRNKDGKRVASGIYMVQTATREGKKGTVCKIAIIN